MDIDRREIFTKANMFTYARIVFSFYLFYLITESLGWITTLVFTIIALTDLIDGWIARKYEEVTRLGAFLDPIADKILVVGCLIILIWYGLWLPTVIVISLRELFIMGIRISAYGTDEEKTTEVSSFGKWKAVFQYVGIGYCLMGFPYFNYVMLIPLVLTIWSGVGYIRKMFVKK